MSTADNRIIPAVLPKNIHVLTETLERLRRAARLVQIDVCDGMFVPSTTFPYARGDETRWRAMLEQSEGLPFWEDFDFEVDLMVKRPQEIALHWVTAGASRIVLHAASATEAELIAVMRELSSIVDMGIAIPCDASLDTHRPLIEVASFVQVMGIARVGFQGQTFDERAVATVATIRSAFPDIPIQIDGGVTPDTAPRLATAGATALVAGSYILSADIPATAIAALRDAAGWKS